MAAAAIPVFMLPHTLDMAIPEDATVCEGFMVRVSLPPHRHRQYYGLVSISDPNLEAIELTSTTAVEFRSFVATTTMMPPLPL